MSTQSMLRRLLLAAFSHRTLAIARWDLHFLVVRAKNALGLRRRALNRRVQLAHRPLFLNLGSGPRGLEHANWVNVDGFKDSNVHYVMDFTRLFPFSENTFDGIFCEHVMEHFDFEGGNTVFRECLRVLRPGGVIRTVVPDGSLILRAYFDEPLKLVERRSVASKSAMDAVNSYFRQRYEHQCIYDFELMRHSLATAGFDPIRHEQFRKGHGPAELLIDDEKYDWESLYCEAVKPTLRSTTG